MGKFEIRNPKSERGAGNVRFRVSDFEFRISDFEFRISPRPAFTLLEILVATAVSVLLMGALYMAISVQLRHAQIGRDLVEESLLARALLARIDTDIRLSLGAPAPASPGSSNPAGSAAGGGSSSAAGGSGSGSSGTASGAAGSTQASGTSSTASGTSSTSNASTASSSSNGAGTVQFNLWVQGDTNWIMLYISRVPRELNPIPGADTDAQPSLSDLRRVSYWLAGGSNPTGLARQEVTMVTSDQAMADVPPSIPDEASMVIADEVKSLTFSYWDGTAWQDSWDGTAPGADGNTPVGPPVAIAVTLGIATSGPDGSTNANQPLKLHRHVVFLATANGTPATSGTSTP